MDNYLVINETKEYVKSRLLGESSGHDWWHVYRVWKMSKKIGSSEDGVNMTVVELAALLHDISDWKFNAGDESQGVMMAKRWLEGLKVDDEIVSNITEIIGTMSFKGSSTKVIMKTTEGMIVQDADRLDAIGAVGIARGFLFAGHKGLPMFDPEIKPITDMNEAQYKDLTRKSYTQINHFYEKLLLLKDTMNTKVGRQMAEGRHQFMEQYLKRFYKEWEGEE